MAKGDKKKKTEKSTLEVSFTKLAENCSASSVVSEPPLPPTPPDQHSSQNAQLSSALSSQPTINDNLELTSEELFEWPVLVNIIVQRYDGEKYRGQFHGEGTAYFQGGHVYKGMFEEGRMHGHGIYTWQNGVIYEGDFAFNRPKGHGAYTWPDGSCYQGEVYNAIRHGVGTYSCAPKKISYRGQWCQGKRHGKGTIYYNQEKTSWYEGDWVNNIKDGWGVRRYASGNVYEGQWKNDTRHGQGMMKWLALGQQYSGQWENGIQHGHGRHTWFLRRARGSQYPLRNEYIGEFVKGLRCGRGEFHYASGALYNGDWQGNQKHGQGKFTFKNGRIFEGEFVNDRMAEFPEFSMDGRQTPDLSGIRTHSPPYIEGESIRGAKEPDNYSSTLGPDMALNIQSLLDRFPKDQREAELKQVEFAVLRHVAELRVLYSFYSALGHQRSPDNTFVLTRLQFWRLLKDCGADQQGFSLAQVDRLLSEDVHSEEIHSPFGTMLLRKFLSYMAILAYHIFHKEIQQPTSVLAACFSRLMRENIIPSAKNVKGILFCNPLRAVIAVNYIERCWEIYQAFCRLNSSTQDALTMTMRHFIWMLKDLKLYDDCLTTGKALEILSAENPAVCDVSLCNLDREMTFLEFYEALLGCAEVKGASPGREPSDSLSEICRQVGAVRLSPGEESRGGLVHFSKRLSASNEPTSKLSSPKIDSEMDSAKTLEMEQSNEMQRLSTSEERNLQRSVMLTDMTNSKGLTGDTGGGSSSQQEYQTEPGGDPMVRSMPALDTLSPSPLLPPTAEPAQGIPAESESELDQWIQKIHLFFTKTFFPAYEYSLLLRREVQEERLRQEAQDRIALAKAWEAVRLREQREAEEERRREEEGRREEEEEGEEAEAPEGESSPPSPAVPTPVASNSSLTATKQPAAGGAKKKKK